MLCLEGEGLAVRSPYYEVLCKMCRDPVPIDTHCPVLQLWAQETGLLSLH